MGNMKGDGVMGIFGAQGVSRVSGLGFLTAFHHVSASGLDLNCQRFLQTVGLCIGVQQL